MRFPNSERLYQLPRVKLKDGNVADFKKSGDKKDSVDCSEIFAAAIHIVNNPHIISQIGIKIAGRILSIKNWLGTEPTQ